MEWTAKRAMHLWISRSWYASTVAAFVGLRGGLLLIAPLWMTSFRTLRSRIEMEIEKLEKQHRLMSRVGYWFLLPMLIANGLSTLGGYDVRTGNHAAGAVGWVLFATCCVLYGFTYWYVRYELKRKWDPVLARLRGLHADLVGTTD